MSYLGGLNSKRIPLLYLLIQLLELFLLTFLACNAAAAGIAIGDSTESVVTTHYAPDTIETQRIVSEQIDAKYNHLIRGNA